MSQLSTEYQVRAQLFAMLYEDYQKPIERYLKAWVNDLESAREICQETFAYFWQFLTKETVVQPVAKYKTDLYTTAKYRAIDYLRRHNKPVVYLSQSESEANSWFDELRTEGHENWICDRDRLREVLAQMPLRHQQCVQLIDQGLKKKDIAVELGVRPSRVSEIMREVRAELRAYRKYYPAAHSLQQQVLFWRQDAEKLRNYITDYSDVLTTKLDPKLQLDEWFAFYGKSKGRVNNDMNALRNSWIKLVNKGANNLDGGLPTDEYDKVCDSDLSFTELEWLGLDQIRLGGLISER